MGHGIRERLERLSSSGIADARGKQGALEGAIRRLHGAGTVAGTALTARCAEGSVAAVIHALEQAQPGQVLVIQGGGEWAYSGELTGAEAVRRGIVAFAIDGLVRDLERLSTIDLQVFARGTTPQGARVAGAGEANVPLTIGADRVVVNPGDWVVGDVDGVTVIPAGEVEAVVARGEEIAAAEAACFERILGGASLLDEPYGDSTMRAAATAGGP